MSLTTLRERLARETPLARLLRRATVLLGGNLGAAVLGFLTLAVAARSLGPTGLGTLVLITAWVQAVDKLVNFQSWQALIRYGARAREQQAWADYRALLRFGFLLDLGTAVLGTALAMSGASLFCRWQGLEAGHATLALLYSLTILLHLSGMPTAVLRLDGRFRTLAGIQVLTGAVRLAAVLVSALAGSGVGGFLLAWALGDVTHQVGLAVMALRDLRAQGHGGFLRERLGPLEARFPGLWRFAISSNLSTAVLMTSRQMDVFIVGALLDPAAVGLYRLARQIAGSLSRITDPLYQVIYPDLAHFAASGDWRRFAGLGLRSGALAGLFAGTGFALALFTIEPALALFFGPVYAASAGVALWCLLAVVLAVAGFPLNPMLLSLGRSDSALVVQTLYALVHLGSLVPLMQVFGLPGAGMAYALAVLLWFVGHVWLVNHYLQRRRRTATASREAT